jgi:hypothetical protein
LELGTENSELTSAIEEIAAKFADSRENLLQYTAIEIADFAKSRGNIRKRQNHVSEFDDFAAHSLCVFLCALCASVVKDFLSYLFTLYFVLRTMNFVIHSELL